MRKIKLLTGILLITLMITGLVAGCSANTQSEEPTPLDYSEITALITSYEDAYRNHIQNDDGGFYYVTATGKTPLGCDCTSRYVVSEDGVYESCSLEVSRDNRTEYDEYFKISDSIMMAVRTYLDEDSVSFSISKYIFTNGAMYYINDDTQTCDVIEDIESMDFLTTFEQVRNVYGAAEDELGQEEQEEQSAA